jgi:phosphoserine phosphatase
MARIVFDLDGTLVGFERRPPFRLALNRPMAEAAAGLRARGHTLVLWTFGNRPWWREVRRRFPVLRALFREVHTRDDLPGRVTEGRGFPEPVKDVRLVRGDVLVDNDPAHYEWARRHGLAHRYVLVPTFGTVA